VLVKGVSSPPVASAGAYPVASRMSPAFTARLAERTKGVTSSAIREILKVATRPDVTSFAGGLPAPELFPLDAIREAADRVLSGHGAAALQYGATDGVLALRQHIAEAVSDSEAGAAAAAGLGAPERLTPDQVMITTGSQQALDLISKLLIDPGDVVGTENPSYLGGLQAFRLHQARLIAVAMDHEGARPDSLASTVGPEAKFIYLLPTFQNPTGKSMSNARRLAVAATLAEVGVPVVEDDPYGALYFDAPPGPSLRSLVPDLALGLGTFSKTLAPGLRLGWIVGPREVIAKLTQLKQSGDLHSSTLCQYVALDVLRSGAMSAHLERLRAVTARGQTRCLQHSTSTSRPKCVSLVRRAACSCGSSCRAALRRLRSCPWRSRRRRPHSCPARRSIPTAAAATPCGSTSPTPRPT